ncbi:EamA/RhaT family transporter [Pseudomonas sp. C2L12B]|nr:EamA/RhaT family transporter [Pseudomonas typographi]MBD1587544.1 EamA/RhaT family transporter [Pseudomonas typographi]
MHAFFKHPRAIGVGFAVLATFCWGLNFIVPYVPGRYSVFDFLAIRFMVVGALGIAWGFSQRAAIRGLAWPLRRLGLALGAIGYFGYALCTACAIELSGPVLMPAFVAAVPVLLALLGNTPTKMLAWRTLLFPLSLLAGGLLLITLRGNNSSVADPHTFAVGVVFSLVAVALWLSFSVLNQNALGKIPARSTGGWTALMMAGSALCMLVLMPLGYALHLFKLPCLGASYDNAGSLYAWAIVIALFSSVFGAWAWNMACRYLPLVLSGQLIALESMFATLLCLAFEKRLPRVHETLAITAVLTGTTLAIRLLWATNEAGGQR